MLRGLLITAFTISTNWAALIAPVQAAPPTIDSISPNRGLTLGGTLVSINGANLDTATSVTIDAQPLANLVIVDSTTITGNTPAGSTGTANLEIVNASGSATLVNGFEYLAGIPAQKTALRFDGLNDVATFGNAAALTDHTLEAWVKPESTQLGVIVGQLAGPSAACNNGTLLLGDRTQLGYNLDPAGCGTGNTFLLPGAFLNVWTHLAGTFDSATGTARLYIDGELVNERVGLVFQPATWITAGAVTFFNGQQAFFAGELDEIRFWNHPRTIQQIQDAMFRPLNGSESGLVGYWRFDDGSGQQVADSSRAGITGVLGTTNTVQTNDPAWVDSQAPLFRTEDDPPPITVIEDVVVDDDWAPVALPQTVGKPVVIAGTPTFRDTQPGLVRLRNLAPGRVEARFQEWRYLDDEHSGESLAMLAMSKGRHEMADGSIWEVGVLKVRNNRKWKRKKFRKRFRKSPEVFLTVQSNRGETPVTVRARNVTKRGFEAALLEEERDLKTGHPKETVGYLAVFSKKRKGTVVDDLGPRPYRLKRARVKDRFKKVLGELLKVEEERSQGRETRHGKEQVSTLVIGDSVFAQQITDREPDTTTIRRREP